MLVCGEIMRAMKTCLYADDPTETAVAFMSEKHMGLVPVVERNETFAGLLSGDRLMHLMLPKHLTMIRGLNRMSYLRESKEELLERLEELSQRPIREVMDERAKVVHLDTPMIEAQKILAGTQFVVPVVDKETRKLLGAISFFTILSLLRDEEGWGERIQHDEGDA